MRASTSRCVLIFAVLVAALAFVSSAHAETAGPEWKILSVSNPTNFKPGRQIGRRRDRRDRRQCRGRVDRWEPGHDQRFAAEGLIAVEVFGLNAYHDPLGHLYPSNTPTEQQGDGLACTFSAAAVSCTTSEPIDPGDTLIVTIRVHVERIGSAVHLSGTGPSDRLFDKRGVGVGRRRGQRVRQRAGHDQLAVGPVRCRARRADGGDVEQPGWWASELHAGVLPQYDQSGRRNSRRTR